MADGNLRVDTRLVLPDQSNNCSFGAVVVAQLVEQSLPTPEISGSNPNIGKFYLPIVHRNRKEEINGPFWDTKPI